MLQDECDQILTALEHGNLHALDFDALRTHCDQCCLCRDEIIRVSKRIIHSRLSETSQFMLKLADSY